MKRIYLDHAASTPVDPLVVEAMEPFWNKDFANANALHEEGRAARRAVEKARNTIAKLLGAQSSEIIFTGSGTEANTLSLRGVLAALRTECSPKETHVITTSIEHASILDCYRALEEEGYRVTVLPVDKDGRVVVRALTEALTPATVLVSVMHANNEIGTLQPLDEVQEVIETFRKKHKTPFPYFHTDASQAPLFERLDVSSLRVDLLTVDAQKMYGPKGVGVLYIRTGVPISPLCEGGSQEKGLRPGTINTPGVVGMARAYELAEMRREEDMSHIKTLRDYFYKSIKNAVPDVVINGSMEHRLPNNLNISVSGLESEYVQAALDQAGIAASSRSACLSGGDEGSYVVAALGTGNERSAIRFTFGREIKKEDVDRVVQDLVEIAARR